MLGQSKPGANFPTSRIRAVAFDMDGLMFNTEDLYDDVTNTVLQRRGFQFSLDLKLKMMGLPGPRAFAVLQEMLPVIDAYENFQREMDAEFQEILPVRIQKMPGLDLLLQILEQTGVPKVVATSSHREFAERALGQFELIPRFEFLITGNEVANGKPHPEIYLTAAERLGVAPREMLVLEDSFNGSLAGAASGAFTVAIPTSHSRQLDFGHAQYVASSLDDPHLLSFFASPRLWI